MIIAENPLIEAIRKCANELSTCAIWLTDNMKSSNSVTITIELNKKDEQTWTSKMVAEGK